MSKIVVVDDSQAELQLIESYLKAAHHTVVTFPNTEQLEEKILTEMPDLIVMDVVMPGRNGFPSESSKSQLFMSVPSCSFVFPRDRHPALTSNWAGRT